MSDEIDSPRAPALKGTLVYDDQCRFCIASANRLKPKLKKHRYGLASFSDPAMRKRFDMKANDRPGEMKLILAGGKVLAGADAAIHLMRLSWWSYPLYHILRAPGIRAMTHVAYEWIAKNRHLLIKCDSETCSRDSMPGKK